MSSVYTKIINHEAPAYILYDDDYIMAFLDINPINPGHTLVVPKIEIDYFIEVPEPYFSKVFQSTKLIIPAIEKVVKCKRVGAVIAGFGVPHFHLHLVPLIEGEEDLDGDKRVELTEIEMKSIAKEIKQHIDAHS
jgi:histidine triad (HIT) family protein